MSNNPQRKHVEPESNFARLATFARMGFNVVPQGMRHDKLGEGMLHMNGLGLKFEPFDTSKAPLILTWEEFDKGPSNHPTAGGA
jgi:hypothetical protein